MYNILLNAHSGLRWLVLIFLIVAVARSLNGWLKQVAYTKSDNLIAVLLLSFTHLQVILGIVLYAVSPIAKSGIANMASTMKDTAMRFWTVEHAFMMVLVVILITVGRVTSKKAKEDVLRHKKSAIFFGLSLAIVLWAGVVKPYALGRGWF